MQPPDELRDGTRAAGWLNKLRAWALSTRLVEGVGYELNQTTRGVSLVIRPGKNGAGTPPTNIRQMRVKSVADDALVCIAWPGAVLGGSLDEANPTDSVDGEFEETVAKPWRLRKTPFHGRTVRIPLEFSPFAMTVSYNYLGASARAATKVGTSIVEKQYIVPRYVKGDVIYVGTSDATGIEGVQLIDLNVDGRAWSAHLTTP